MSQQSLLLRSLPIALPRGAMDVQARLRPVWRHKLRISLKIAVFTGVSAGLLALTACGHSQPTTATVNNYQTQGLPLADLVQEGMLGLIRASEKFDWRKGFRFSITLGGGKSTGPAGTGIQVNAYLWRATLDTLSFMPLVSADPFGGVIITDWYSPPATPDERFKANAYILSQQMTANAIQISLFHQVQQNGQWVNAAVDPNTVSGLEDRILARAADLRAAAENTQD